MANFLLQGKTSVFTEIKEHFRKKLHKTVQVKLYMPNVCNLLQAYDEVKVKYYEQENRCNLQQNMISVN